MEIFSWIFLAIVIVYVFHSLNKIEKLITKLDKESVKVKQYEQEIYDLSLWIDNIKDLETRTIALEDKLGIKRKEY